MPEVNKTKQANKKWKQIKKYRIKHQAYQFGQRHQKQYFNATLDMSPAATNYYSFTLSDIGLGDKYDERNTDMVYMNSATLRLSARNEHTTPRFLRMLVLKLSDSDQNKDTTTWTDLFINNNYTKTAPNGSTNDILYTVNKDEYRVIYDDIVRVGCANDGQSTLNYRVNIPIKKLIKWAYNTASDVRKNKLWFVILNTESEGVTVNAAHTSIGLMLITNYTDVDGYKSWPHQTRRYTGVSTGVQAGRPNFFNYITRTRTGNTRIR